MGRITLRQILDLLLATREETRGGFDTAKIELIATEQRLASRIDHLENKVDHFQKTYLEDSAVFSREILA